MDHLLDDISFCNFYYYTIFSLFYNISLTLKLFSLQIRYFLDMNAKFGPKIKKKRKEITVKKDTNFQCRVYIMIFFSGFDHVLLLYLLSMTKNFLEISFCLL